MHFFNFQPKAVAMVLSLSSLTALVIPNNDNKVYLTDDFGSGSSESSGDMDDIIKTSPAIVVDGDENDINDNDGNGEDKASWLNSLRGFGWRFEGFGSSDDSFDDPSDEACLDKMRLENMRQYLRDSIKKFNDTKDAFTSFANVTRYIGLLIRHGLRNDYDDYYYDRDTICFRRSELEQIGTDLENWWDWDGKGSSLRESVKLGDISTITNAYSYLMFSNIDVI